MISFVLVFGMLLLAITFGSWAMGYFKPPRTLASPGADRGPYAGYWAVIGIGGPVSVLLTGLTVYIWEGHLALFDDDFLNLLSGAVAAVPAALLFTRVVHSAFRVGSIQSERRAAAERPAAQHL